MKAITSNLDSVLENDFADIWKDMQEMKVTGEELCDYLTWSHYNAIPLIGDDARKAEYRKLATETCKTEFYNPVTELTLKVSEENGNIVSSAFL